MINPEMTPPAAEPAAWIAPCSQAETSVLKYGPTIARRIPPPRPPAIVNAIVFATSHAFRIPDGTRRSSAATAVDADAGAVCIVCSVMGWPSTLTS
jgi:hypothetical protein